MWQKYYKSHFFYLNYGLDDCQFKLYCPELKIINRQL